MTPEFTESHTNVAEVGMFAIVENWENASVRYIPCVVSEVVEGMATEFRRARSVVRVGPRWWVDVGKKVTDPRSILQKLKPFYSTHKQAIADIRAAVSQ